METKSRIIYVAFNTTENAYDSYNDGLTYDIELASECDTLEECEEYINEYMDFPEQWVVRKVEVTYKVLNAY